MSLLIVDYGMSNLGSIRRAFEECGADVFVTADPNDLGEAERIVLPGVGAFGDGMAQLRRTGWAEALRTVVGSGIPLLGICLGMQLLATQGVEGGEIAGLGLIPGQVTRLQPDTLTTRIPHVGWNEVYPGAGVPLFSGIAPGEDFYFVHSFHFIPVDPVHIAATTPYCRGFVSAVSAGSVVGVQFHPEKSGRPGFQLLKNFLKM